MPTEGARPLRADAARNRRLVLDTADRMIADRRELVSLNEIAHEAGIGIGTVYRRFPDVRSLVDALYTERFERFVGFASDAAAMPDPGTGLRTYIVTAAEWRAHDPGLDIVLGNADLERAENSALRDQLTRRIDGIVVVAREAGAVRSDFASSDVYTMIAMLGAAADRTESISPGTWRRYAAVLLTGFGIASSDEESVGPMSDDEIRGTWPQPG